MMKRIRYYSGIMINMIAVFSVAVAMVGCGGGTDASALDSDKSVQGPPPPLDLGLDGRTNKPVQAAALPGSGYSIEPLVTVGDEIPLLTGNYPGGNSHPKLTYALPGIPDGMGVVEQGGNYFVWVNSEISAGNFSKYSDTIDGSINGARVSIIKFDSDWRVVGGRCLVEKIWDASGLVGEISVDAGKKTVTQTGTLLSRLCSGGVTELYGSKPVFLAGEESNNGRAFTFDTNGNARRINRLPLFAYENICPISKWSNETVLVGLDDTADRYLVLYIGDRSGSDQYGFESGTSYVGRVLDGGGNMILNSGGISPNTDYTIEWLEIPSFDNGGNDLYNSQSNFYAWASSRATGFMRPEDGHEDPANPGSLHWVATGRFGTYDVYGSVWQLDLGDTPTADGTLRNTSNGSPDYYMNPDNVVTDSFGNFWIQEDPSGTQNLMLAAGRRSSIYRGPIGGDSFVPVFTVLQDTAPFIPPLTQSFANDPWETSGIVEVPGSIGQPTLLFDVQAHGWDDPDYVEGGQIILATPSS